MSSSFVIAQSINNTALLVFLMQAGFTMLEAGSVRERNVSR
jgi:ammonia channel protein AmtB